MYTLIKHDEKKILMTRNSPSFDYFLIVISRVFTLYVIPFLFFFYFLLLFFSAVQRMYKIITQVTRSSSAVDCWHTLKKNIILNMFSMT